jgi:hypothetical protein
MQLNDNSKKLYDEYNKVVGSFPALKNPKGYEIQNIGTPTFGPNGLQNIDNNWKNNNKKTLEDEKKRNPADK